MLNWISKSLDHLSEFLARRKGLLPLLGILLVIINFVLGLLSNGWLAAHDVFLHLGIFLAILGFMLAWAL